jgi:hypothetical protein
LPYRCPTLHECLVRDDEGKSMDESKYAHQDTEFSTQWEELSEESDTKNTSQYRHPEDDPKYEDGFFSGLLDAIFDPKKATGEKSEKYENISDICPIFFDEVFQRSKESIDDMQEVYHMAYEEGNIYYCK